ncbi:MAG: L-fucose/L-arabinose isomerase family protein [Eubacteriales bacterium]|nr:L-fucose/L-arabinose isomerase family protein [Eubacteriales bacterium]MDD4744413.1 L-fucose/L-arabinose isomerase family protein [Eubacteriales bacterium]
MEKRTGMARIGFFAVGHDTYWAQFPGLLDNLLRYHGQARQLVEDERVTVVDYGMVDSNQKAYAVLERMRGDKLDLVMCNMVTYATSATFIPIIRNINIPVVLLALQVLPGMDYSRASTFMQLENDSICAVPEFISATRRIGRRIEDVVIGTLHDDPAAQDGIRRWCGIARVLHALKGARLGLIGHVLEAMYDMHADPAAITAAFDVHVPLIEIDDLVRCYQEVTAEEINRKERVILDLFDTPDPGSDPIAMKLTAGDLTQAAKSAVALDKLVEAYDLTGLAYYYEGLPGSIQREVAGSLVVGNSLLIARGVPMCGEYDIKTLVAMLMMDRLGIGGSFAEFHPFDFRENFILVGHDGPHHIAIAEGRPVLRSLLKYHGKPGSGASVEFQIKEGPITMLGISQKADGQLKFIVGEGQSLHGPIPPTGNTNTRGHFGSDVRAFIKDWVMAGPTHHFALGIGHHAETFALLGQVLDIETTVVRPR